MKTLKSGTTALPLLAGATCAVLFGFNSASFAQDSSASREPAAAQPAVPAPPPAAAANQGQPPARAPKLEQDRIAKEKADAEAQAKTQPIAEAASSLDDTNAAIKALDQNNTAQASAALDRAVGKIDVLLAKSPGLALVPVAAEVRITDLVADESTIKSLTDQVRTAVNQREYQKARRLLQGFASEINISTTNIVMATYPTSVRTASSLLKQGKKDEAKTELLSAVHSFVITEKSIPLPVVRAQALTDEVSRQASAKQLDKTEANAILDEASRQLALAEAMGYGTRKQDFVDVQNSISQAKANINRNQESTGILAKVTSDLRIIKQKVL